MPGLESSHHELTQKCINENRQCIEPDTIEGSSVHSNPIYSFIRRKVSVKAYRHRGITVQEPVLFNYASERAEIHLQTLRNTVYVFFAKESNHGFRFQHEVWPRSKKHMVVGPKPNAPRIHLAS